jgi:hypothetical protein
VAGISARAKLGLISTSPLITGEDFHTSSLGMPSRVIVPAARTAGISLMGTWQNAVVASKMNIADNVFLMLVVVESDVKKTTSTPLSLLYGCY